MRKLCPYCWGKNVRPVGLTVGRAPGLSSGFILECRDCEKWFWANSGLEVPLLFQVCATPGYDPGHCFPEVREAVLWEGTVINPCRQAEFNFLCSRCRHRSFQPPCQMSIVGG